MCELTSILYKHNLNELADTTLNELVDTLAKEPREASKENREWIARPDQMAYQWKEEKAWAQEASD